ncbi:hypothetical protein PIB30_094459 [Stylosanthes scabra]|uniref:Uncharacterized protein n=1 Tax=Stylosanthes scabra TaxID=79078 RepID=A0ABU6TWU9_9FABA|nr:hypothetical protein [Stylosanthes scabra]
MRACYSAPQSLSRTLSCIHLSIIHSFLFATKPLRLPNFTRYTSLPPSLRNPHSPFPIYTPVTLRFPCTKPHIPSTTSSFSLSSTPYPLTLLHSVASSSKSARKRRGKAIAHEDNEFDALRVKSPFHQNFYNTNVASKPIIPDTRFNLEEGQYPHIQQQIELRG